MTAPFGRFEPPSPRWSGEPSALDGLLPELVHHVAELIVVLDPTGVVLWANEGMRRMLGWAPERWVGEHAASLAHPDDIPLGFELLASAKATGLGVKEPVTYRLRHAGGHHVDVECIASIVELSPGQYGIVLSGRLADQARPADAIFDEASYRVSAMFDRALIGLAQVSLDGRVLRANDELARLLGAGSGAELIDRDAADLLPRHVLSGADGLLTGAGAHHPQVRLDGVGHADGGRWVRLATSIVEDHRGDPLYYALQAIDVSDLVSARIRLEVLHDEALRRSQHDDLTGLANRARLAPWLALPADRASVLYLDLDDFKEINDRAGHAAGDATLVAVADRLRSGVRREDVALRLGGDEFLVLCPYTGAADATGLAERLLHRITRPIEHDGTSFEVGTSIGVASGRPGDDFRSLIERADRALYVAKVDGRRRIHAV